MTACRYCAASPAPWIAESEQHTFAVAVCAGCLDVLAEQWMRAFEAAWRTHVQPIVEAK